MRRSVGAPIPAGGPQTQRLVSADAFRGFLILWMLLANYVVWSPRVPGVLQHAAWGAGVTLTDVVFPWFLFTMGVAIPLSFEAARRRGTSAWALATRVVRRSALLFLLGLLVYTAVHWRPYWGLGILQMLGLTYLVGAAGMAAPPASRAAVALTLAAGHWALLTLAPVPGVGAGVLEEDRNVLRYLNLAYFQRYGLAGLPSLVPQSAVVLAGTVVGHVLTQAAGSARARVAWLVGGGIALSLVGWAVRTDVTPNRVLWDPSLVLLTVGTGAALLGLLYGVLDARPSPVARWLAFPLVVFGSNAILLYLGSILFRELILRRWPLPWRADGATLQTLLLRELAGHLGPVYAAWAYTGLVVLFWWCVLYVLYRRRVFLRV